MPLGKVETVLQAQMPHFATSEITGYASLGDRFGGAQSIHLQWSVECLNVFVPWGRTLAGYQCKVIAELPMAYINLKRCFVMAATLCPSSGVKEGGLCAWIAGHASSPKHL
jgi:hypothetical protein